MVKCNEVILKDDPKVTFQILKNLYSVYKKLANYVYHWHDKLKVNNNYYDSCIRVINVCWINLIWLFWIEDAFL